MIIPIHWRTRVTQLWLTFGIISVYLCVCRHFICHVFIWIFEHLVKSYRMVWSKRLWGVVWRPFRENSWFLLLRRWAVCQFSVKSLKVNQFQMIWKSLESDESFRRKHVRPQFLDFCGSSCLDNSVLIILWFFMTNMKFSAY